MRTLTMAFVGIATVPKIFRLRYKTTIITTICNATLGHRLGSPRVPTTAAANFFIVLSEPVPVIPDPPII